MSVLQIGEADTSFWNRCWKGDFYDTSILQVAFREFPDNTGDSHTDRCEVKQEIHVIDLKKLVTVE